MDCQLVDQLGASSYTAGFDQGSQTILSRQVNSIAELVITVLCQATANLFDLSATLDQAYRGFPQCPETFGNVSVTLPQGEWLTIDLDTRSATNWPSTATLDIQSIWISTCQTVEPTAWWIYVIIGAAITVALIAIFLFCRQSNRYQLVKADT